MTSKTTLELVIPRGLEAVTGGFIYDRRIVEQLRRLGWRVTVHELDPGFPLPSDRALSEAAETLGRIPDRRLVVIDGLALGGMPDIVKRECARLRLVALIHHPLAFETGLSADAARTLRNAERRALAAVARIIVTSRTTERALTDYAVSPERVAVVPPGTDPAPLAAGSGDNLVHLLCVATLTPRKGHAILLEALAGLRDSAWRLRCAGSTDRDPDTAAAVRRQIVACELQNRITLLGALEEEALSQEYARADGFVLASHYEGYGMALAEALARGLPVVATAGGAVPETVPVVAGLLVPPGESGPLREALARLIEDRELRARLREGARRVRPTLPTWQDAGERFAAALMATVATS